MRAIKGWVSIVKERKEKKKRKKKGKAVTKAAPGSLLPFSDAMLEKKIYRKEKKKGEKKREIVLLQERGIGEKESAMNVTCTFETRGARKQQKRRKKRVMKGDYSGRECLEGALSCCCRDLLVPMIWGSG